MDGELPDWVKRCPTGKIKFASAKDARAMTRGSGGRRKERSGLTGSMRSYRCPLCDSFHVSSTGRTNR